MNAIIQLDHEFRYGFYCVAYLDILGQRRLLRALPRIPQKDAETTKLLADTAGRVLRLRKRLSDCFEQFQQSTGILDSLPQDTQERIRIAKKAAKYRYFSDSIIMEIAFGGDTEQVAPITGVYASMWACCILHGIALMEGCPLRGGIDVGPGLDISENEAYGPVLERAHYLESKQADYPRVLVGEGLIAYLDAIVNATPTTPLSRLTQSLAVHCKDLITIDADGLPMLDFLGEKMAKAHAPKDRETSFGLISDYVSGQEEFAIAQRDEKHASRYLKLGAYLRERSVYWKNS